MTDKQTVSLGLFDAEIPVLDGIRGISILWVICHHLPLPQDLLPTAVEAIRERGELGVELFFAISGFLVTRSLEQCRALAAPQAPRAAAARDFAIRRIARIWPPYYISLAIFGLAVLLFGSGGIAPSSQSHIAWSVPVFLANYTMPQFSGPVHIGSSLTRSFSNIWSVCFEEQFYLTLGMLFLLFGKNYWRWMAGIGILSTLWRFVALKFLPGVNYQCIHMMTHYRLDAIFWGCIAWIKREELGRLISGSRLIQAALIAFAVFAVLFFPYTTPRDPLKAALAFMFTAPAFTGLIVMLCYTKSPLGRLLESRTLTWVGRCSYELYLIHAVVIWLVVREETLSSVIQVLSIALLLLAAGWVFHFKIGKPTRIWILRMFRSGAPNDRDNPVVITN